MTRPLSDVREREIRDLPKLIRRHAWAAAEDAAWAIRDLLVELDRLRGDAGETTGPVSDQAVLLAVLMRRLGNSVELNANEIEDARRRLHDEQVQFVAFRASFLAPDLVTVKLRSRPRRAKFTTDSDSKEPEA